MKTDEIFAIAKYAAERLNSTARGATMSVHRLNLGVIQLRTFIAGIGETDRTNLRQREAERFVKHKILSCYVCAKNRLAIN